MSNEKNKIEALLFSSGRRMKIDEIVSLTKISDKKYVKQLLDELRLDLESRGGSLVLSDENDYYKMTVKDHYMPVIQRVVSRTELDKPLMETLAVIAWKYPVVQSEVVKIRHNKAYDHLRILEEQGFISRGIFGRTKKITLTEKFFQYFDLPSKEQVKDVFKDIMPAEIKGKLKELEDDIEEGEKLREEAVNRKEELQKQKKELEEQKKIKREQSESEITKEIEELESSEKEVLDDIENDVDAIEKEENKNVYLQDESDASSVSELQESDEVSKQESFDSRQE